MKKSDKGLIIEMSSAPAVAQGWEHRPLFSPRPLNNNILCPGGLNVGKFLSRMRGSKILSLFNFSITFHTYSNFYWNSKPYRHYAFTFLEYFVWFLRISYHTSAPIGAWKCNFPEIMTNQPTSQSTDRSTEQPTNLQTGIRGHREVTLQIINGSVKGNHQMPW